VTRKANARARLKKVDAVIEAVRASGVKCAALVSISAATSSVFVRLIPQDRALELPKEHEMPARDKYTVFSPRVRGYRKGIHKVPKWTRVRSLCFLFKSCFLILFDSVDAENEPKGFLTIFERESIYYISCPIMRIVKTVLPGFCPP
jgi:hypothetical protein